MPAPNAQQQVQTADVKIVGGNKFGRYPKISVEQTFNFIVSDDALVPYAGYKRVIEQDPTEPGRGIYSSSVGNIMVAVWGAQVFAIDLLLSATFVGTLATSAGDVFISENNNQEIAITDGVNLYVYNYGTGTFKTSGVDFMVGTFVISAPGYISFQNGRLIVVNLGTQNWYLSGLNNALVWFPTAGAYVSSLQTKPDTVQAAVPTPGGGNNLLLLGHTVAEQWQDVGNALFPYQRSSTSNVDFGCLNASTIAALDTFVVWLSGNEQSGPVLMVYSGNQTQRISTDGIDYKLSNLSNPTNCTGFLFRQDGHLIYQFTFPDDNLSYIYDFNTQLFCTVTDENLNYHIARDVVFFNNNYYLVSLKGGNLYEFDTQFTDFEYASDDIRPIPRFRVTEPFRLPDQRMFIIKSLGFTIENGQPNLITSYPYTDQVGDLIDTESSIDIVTEGGTLLATEGDLTTTNTYTLTSEAVDLSISRDGGESFGSSWRLPMNPVGKRKSRFIWQRLGQANDVTFQFRFTGFGRFVVFNGQLEWYK